MCYKRNTANNVSGSKDYNNDEDEDDDDDNNDDDDDWFVVYSSKFQVSLYNDKCSFISEFLKCISKYQVEMYNYYH